MFPLHVFLTPTNCRARHVDNLGFLLDFLKRVAEQYSRRNEAIDFVTALLKLNTPWLFSALGEQGGSIAVNVQGVRREFALFLKQYIERNSLNKALLDKTEEIWVSQSFLHLCHTLKLVTALDRGKS